MKKFFSYVAAALVAFSFASCDNNNLVVKIQASGENVYFEDNVAEEGWWQITATTDLFMVNLSNADEVTSIPGKYTLDDLDPEYTYIADLESEEKIELEDGYVEVTVLNNGKQVNAFGKFTDEDGIVYELNLVYTEPEAKKTVNMTLAGTLYDEYASEGLYAVYGVDGSNNYVQIAFWANQLQGHFTTEDLDNYYLGSFVEDADGQHVVYSGSMDITPGNGQGYYTVVAELLCLNNTLYRVNMAVTPLQAAVSKKMASKKALRKTAKNGKRLD